MYVDGPMAGGILRWHYELYSGAQIHQPMEITSVDECYGRVQRPLGPRGHLMCDYEVVDGEARIRKVEWRPGSPDPALHGR